MLKALLPDPTPPPTPEDAERLRDSLVWLLERLAESKKGLGAEQLSELSGRLSRFPTPTGLLRQLERVVGPVKAERERPEPGEGALEEALEALFTVSLQVALPDEELSEALQQARRKLPPRIHPLDLKKISRDFKSLGKVVEPLRQRYLDACEECNELLRALVTQLSEGRDANSRIAGRAVYLVEQLVARSDPEAARALREELLSGLQEISADARRLQDTLASCEAQLTQLQSQLDLRTCERDDARQQALLDPLTGLLNRRGFSPLLEEMIKDSRTRSSSVSLIFIDLDRFKALNDQYGHPAGDHVLKATAQVLMAALPRSALTARLGGEELAVALPGVGERSGDQIAEQLREAIAAQLFVSGGERFRVTASLGLTQLKPQDSAAQLLARADQALYRAKAEGRNCWRRS